MELFFVAVKAIVDGYFGTDIDVMEDCCHECVLGSVEGVLFANTLVARGIAVLAHELDMYDEAVATMLVSVVVQA